MLDLRGLSVATSFDDALPIEAQLPLVAEAGFTHVALGGNEPHSRYLSASARREVTRRLRARPGRRYDPRAARRRPGRGEPPGARRRGGGRPRLGHEYDLAGGLGFDREEPLGLARNAVRASFAPPERRAALLGEIDAGS